MLLMKIWKLCIKLKDSLGYYGASNRKQKSEANLVALTFPLELYEQFIPLLSKGLGSYYDNTSYQANTASKASYNKDYVKFDRF